MVCLMMHLILIVARAGRRARRGILRDERMLQQLLRSPSLARIPLETAGNEISKLRRSSGRCLRRLRHANGTHEAGPIPLPPDRKRKSPQVKFQYADTQTPYIPSVPVVLPVIQICVDSFGAHVGNSAHRGIARIHCLIQDSGDPKISNFRYPLRVDQ